MKVEWGRSKSGGVKKREGLSLYTWHMPHTPANRPASMSIQSQFTECQLVFQEIGVQILKRRGNIELNPGKPGSSDVPVCFESHIREFPDLEPEEYHGGGKCLVFKELPYRP